MINSKGGSVILLTLGFIVVPQYLEGEEYNLSYIINTKFIKIKLKNNWYDKIKYNFICKQQINIFQYICLMVLESTTVTIAI